MANLPSVETLLAIKGVTPEIAKEMRTWLKLLTVGVLRRMEECDGLLDASYGVERLYSPNGSLEVYYLNLGETYETTLLYDKRTARFSVGSWGDLVEKLPKRFA